jgi:hypothetical protein
MRELSRSDWLFVGIITFVGTVTVFAILYWLYLMGW